MKIKLNPGVYVRHVEDESIVWCPRTDGTTVFGDGKVFLEELTDEWREEVDVLNAIAQKFECEVKDIREDFRLLLTELVAQGFVGCLDDVDVDWHDSLNLEQGEAWTDENEPQRVSFCKRHGIPAELHLDMTDACTERCVHCYVPHGQRHFLATSLIEKALAEFRELNGLAVHLTGGEAMLHPDFESVCKKCVALNLSVIVFSNLTLCDDNRIALLKEINPQFINVSLYSMKAEEHDTITNLPGSWKRTMDAILKCCEAGLLCRIATPVLRENRNALSALKEFAEEHQMLFVPDYEIVAQVDHSCGNLDHACSAKELQAVLSQGRDCFRKTANMGVRLSADNKVCSIGAARLYLNAKGEYYPCDSMHGYVLGNVRDNTMEEIWNGEKLNYLRELKNRDFGVCASCEKRPWCKVCPAANFNATGDLFTHHPGACTLAGVVKEVYGIR